MAHQLTTTTRAAIAYPSMPVLAGDGPVTDAAALALVDAWAEAEAEAMIRAEGYVGIRADRLLHAGWPVEAIDWTLDTYPAATPARVEAVALARQLAADPAAFEAATGRAGLGLGGRPGRGKTGLAAAVGAAMIEDGRDVLFVRWGALADEAFAALGTARTGHTADRDGVSAVTARLAVVDVLIVDDLGEAGASSQPDFLRRVLREVVWPRYERRAITIVTTNLPASELEAQFGEAALSRLAGMLRWVALDGADERRKVVAA